MKMVAVTNADFFFHAYDFWVIGVCCNLYVVRVRLSKTLMRIFCDSKPVATLDSLLKSLVKSFPSIGPFLPVCAVALNRQYLDMGDLALSTALASGDQVSIMPPVSGG